MTREPTYDRNPTVPLPAGARIAVGDEIWTRLRSAVSGIAAPVIAIDAYPGTDIAGLLRAATRGLPGFAVLDMEDAAARPLAEIDAALESVLTDDRVFGVMNEVAIEDFYVRDALERTAREIADDPRPTVVVGWGAALAAPAADVVVLADLARWEIQRRYRAGAPNWRCGNGDEDPLRKYKRGFFVEWRAADRHKQRLLAAIDFVLDTNRGIDDAALVEGGDFRDALVAASAAPFRLVPFFDPGPWGGQWMKRTIGLGDDEPNYAWCFDCVPEENSLLLEADGRVAEIPAMDLVLFRPRELLGERTFARFGAEFPIRFDFLDTIEGGNLSLQVHPLTEYIRTRFGMGYTQDESYYLLDASDDAVVYLGLREGIDPADFEAALRRASDGGESFAADEYVNRFPVRKHDHVSIPAGTVHCSGAGSMVLEISATPYIFTFKLWDWGRLGLDGVPRPIHLDHGLANVQWDRDTAWVRENLVGRVDVLSDADGVREERTGLHELEFIEVRRHWFASEVAHDTQGTVNVLNLVEGDEVEVVSPSGAFAPFTVHYAETFVVPASVGAYVIRPTADSTAERFGTVKAFVRGTAAAASPSDSRELREVRA